MSDSNNSCLGGSDGALLLELLGRALRDGGGLGGINGSGFGDGGGFGGGGGFGEGGGSGLPELELEELEVLLSELDFLLFERSDEVTVGMESVVQLLFGR